jgi:signal transduction histidine kinase
LIQNSLIHGFENIENGIIDIDVIQRNESVRIEYRDNGCGIPDDVIPLIFEPFFTTKRKEGGSGLGTHILFNLVTQTLQGKIKCIDTDMNGCFFEIDFPRQIALKQDDME